MPRLRNTNTLITDRSQVQDGDCLVFNGSAWDAIGIASKNRRGESLEMWTDEIEYVGHYDMYRFGFGGVFMKISSHTFDRLKAQQDEYYRETGDLEGFRTGLFQ